MYTLSSPKKFLASCCAAIICDSKSSGESTRLIPRPPPPADAFTSTGYPSGAEAIHPGFGFLSENAEFAKLCEKNGIVFIGPSYKSIEILGDKAAAKETMSAAGVPVIPGSKGAVKSIDEAKKIAEECGYPVLVKASAGGGGRGIRRVDSPDKNPNPG